MLRSLALVMLLMHSSTCFLVSVPWRHASAGARPRLLSRHEPWGLRMSHGVKESSSSRLRSLFNQLEEDGRTALSLPEFEQLRVQSMVKRCAEQSNAGQDIAPISLSSLQENSKWALCGRWKMIFAPLEQMKFWSFYPRFQLFLDLDMKKSSIDFNLNFGEGPLLQGFKCSARSCLRDQRFLLSYTLWRIAICIAGVWIRFPVPGFFSGESRMSASYFDGDLWMEDNGKGDFYVFRYIGPVPEEHTTAVAESKESKSKWETWTGRMRRKWQVSWRVLLLLSVIALNVVLVTPLLFVASVAYFLFNLLNMFSQQDSESNKESRWRAV